MNPIHHSLLLNCPFLPHLNCLFILQILLLSLLLVLLPPKLVLCYIILLTFTLILPTFILILSLFPLSLLSLFMCSTERRFTTPSNTYRRNRALPRLHSITERAWRARRRSLPAVPCPSRRLHLHTGQQHESLG
jgi:hypothetical protein